MKNILILSVLLMGINAIGQKKMSMQQLATWQKAVVNIETEGWVYPQYVIDSILKSKLDSGYSTRRLDSVSKMLHISTSSTGTALYVSYLNRKYLITAKHVLSDPVFINQKIHENNIGTAKWDKLEAIYPRISIRTSFEYYNANKQVNDFGVFNNSFTVGPKPYFFISDSTGDGIGIISLQEIHYKLMDTILQRNGYIPIPIEKIISDDEINPLDEIYAIGFPEMVSVVGQVRIAQNIVLVQSLDLVNPLIVKGTVAMYNTNIQHFYVDLTINPGNSGSPIIRNDKLVGIVSGLNKYRIIDENNRPLPQPLYGIGHLVNIIKTASLKESLTSFREQENQFINQ